MTVCTATACGDGAPASDAADVDVVLYVFDKLPYPLVEVVDAPDDFATATADALTLDPSLIRIDWPTQAAVVFALPTSSCGRDLVGFEVDENDLLPVWEIPDECDSDLRSLNLVAVVDRTTLIAGERLVLPAMPPFFNDDVAAPIEIEPPPSE